MAVLSRRRRLLLALAGCCVAAVVTAVAVASASHRSSSSRPTLRVLQMNLCNSGIAGCYTGRSVARAAAIIASVRPDLVTLNEVCRDDVSALDRALAESAGAGTSAFRPALDRGSHDAVHCRNGQEFGIGLVARGTGSATSYGGSYPMQDSSDVENRVWLCVRADAYFCTTHLDSVGRLVAYQQCRFLLHTAIPGLVAKHGPDGVVVGGDLNLVTGRSPDPRSCFPAGDAHADDGARQHVVASGFRVVSARTIDMQGTTDHPGLLVDLVRRG